ncbi:MAG: zeta toxin family protein [Candidatus Cryptobacteroides sp.]
MVNPGHRPELIIIAGPNGSGKTSVTYRFLHHEWAEGTIYINPDEIARDKFGDWNSQKAILSAASYCAKWREDCLKEKISFVFETVMSAEDKIDFIIRAKEAGYFIRLFFISTSHPSINAARIAGRVMKGGHDVPIPKIISRYYKSIENCKTVAPIVDRLYVYDNSTDGEEAKILFRLVNGVMGKMYVSDVPLWAQTLLPDTYTLQDSGISD